MKFTLNAVNSNVISITTIYLYLYNITSFCFDCSKLCSNCYCYSILPFKRCYIKRLTSKRELSIPRLCFIPALGSGSVFRAFGILESRPELRAAASGCRLLQAKGRPRRTNTNCRTYKGLSCSLQPHTTTI